MHSFQVFIVLCKPPPKTHIWFASVCQLCKLCIYVPVPHIAWSRLAKARYKQNLEGSVAPGQQPLLRFSHPLPRPPQNAIEQRISILFLKHRLDLAIIHPKPRGGRSTSRVRSKAIGGRRACTIVSLHKPRTSIIGSRR